MEAPNSSQYQGFEPALCGGVHPRLDLNLIPGPYNRVHFLPEGAVCYRDEQKKREEEQ